MFITFAELRVSDYHWPVSETKKGEILYCGEPAVNGCPYCTAHTVMAHRPPVRRRMVDQKGYEPTIPAAHDLWDCA